MLSQIQVSPLESTKHLVYVLFTVQSKGGATQPYPVVKHPGKYVLHPSSVFNAFGASEQLRYLQVLFFESHTQVSSKIDLADKQID